MEKNIVDMVLQDVREGDGEFSEKLIEKPMWNEFSERWNIYNDEKNIPGRRKIDADHWKRALDSYRCYPCFQENYYFSKDTIQFDNGEVYVHLTADLLTNAQIVEWKKQNSDLDINGKEKIIDAFYQVSYTIGNFCPIWKNVGGKGNDNIWYKLYYGGFYKDILTTKIKGILDREDTKDRKGESANLLRRKTNDLFIILQEQDTKEIISKLFFIDYFDNNDELLLFSSMGKESKCSKEKMLNSNYFGQKEFFEYLKMLTKLIVQRGYRIVTGYSDPNFNDSQKKDIKNLFEQIGLENETCICSV